MADETGKIRLEIDASKMREGAAEAKKAGADVVATEGEIAAAAQKAAEAVEKAETKKSTARRGASKAAKDAAVEQIAAANATADAVEKPTQRIATSLASQARLLASFAKSFDPLGVAATAAQNKLQAVLTIAESAQKQLDLANSKVGGATGKALENLLHNIENATKVLEQASNLVDPLAGRLNDAQRRQSGGISAEEKTRLSEKFDPIGTSAKAMASELKELNDARKAGVTIAGGYANAEAEIIEKYNESAVAGKKAALAQREMIQAAREANVATQAAAEGQAKWNAFAGIADPQGTVGGKAFRPDRITADTSVFAGTTSDEDKSAKAIKEKADQLRALSKEFNSIKETSLAYEAATKRLDLALKEGVVNPAQHAVELDKLNKQMALGVAGTDTYNGKMKGLASSNSQAAFAQRQLAVQTTQFFYSVDAGMPIMMALIQQGHQVMDVAFATGTGFKALTDGISKAFTGMVGWIGRNPILTAIIAITSALAAFAAMAESAARAQAKLRTELSATRGDAPEAAARAIDISRHLASTTQISTSDARKSAQEIISLPNFTGTNEDMEKIIKQAHNLAMVLNIDVVDAAKKFGDAITDPSKALDSLLSMEKPLKGLTNELALSIQQMIQLGDKAGATTALLALLGQAGKEAETQQTKFQRALSEVTKAFTTAGVGGRSFVDIVGNAALLPVIGALRVVTFLVNGFMAVVNAVVPVFQGLNTVMEKVGDAFLGIGKTGSDFATSMKPAVGVFETIEAILGRIVEFLKSEPGGNGDWLKTIANKLLGLDGGVSTGGGGGTGGTIPRNPGVSLVDQTNNPMNLTALPGQASVGRFRAFNTMEEGVTAAVKQLQINQDTHGKNTLAEQIKRWAPPGENDTEGYINRVSKETGLGRDKPFDTHDAELVKQVVTSMIGVEIGRKVDPAVVSAGVAAGMKGGTYGPPAPVSVPITPAKQAVADTARFDAATIKVRELEESQKRLLIVQEDLKNSNKTGTAEWDANARALAQNSRQLDVASDATLVEREALRARVAVSKTVSDADAKVLEIRQNIAKFNRDNPDRPITTAQEAAQVANFRAAQAAEYERSLDAQKIKIAELEHGNQDLLKSQKELTDAGVTSGDAWERNQRALALNNRELEVAKDTTLVETEALRNRIAVAKTSSDVEAKVLELRQKIAQTNRDNPGTVTGAQEEMQVDTLRLALQAELAKGLDAVRIKIKSLEEANKSLRMEQEQLTKQGITSGDVWDRNQRALAQNSRELAVAKDASLVQTEAMQDQAKVAGILSAADAKVLEIKLKIAEHNRNNPNNQITSAQEATQLNAALAIMSGEYGKLIQQIDLATDAEVRLNAARQKGPGAVREVTADVEATNKVRDQFPAGPARDAAQLEMKNKLIGQEQEKAKAPFAAEIDTNSRTIKMIEAQTGSLTMNNNQRVMMLANLEAEQRLQAAGIPLSDKFAQTYLESAKAVAAANLEFSNIQKSLDTVAGMFEQSFDTIGNAITNSLMGGTGAAVNWRNVMTSVAQQVLQQFLKLAVLNPLLNSMFGGDRPTLGGVWDALNKVGGGGGGMIPGSTTGGGSGGSGMGVAGQALGLIGKIGGFIGGLFGGGGASAFAGTEIDLAGIQSSAIAANPYSYVGSIADASPGALPPGLYHSGGLVGYDAVPHRMIAANLNNLPRFHNGLGGDEFAAILQKGERVMTKNQQSQVKAAAANSNEGGHTFVFQFPATTTPDSFRRAGQQVAGQMVATLNRTQSRNGSR